VVAADAVAVDKRQWQQQSKYAQAPVLLVPVVVQDVAAVVVVAAAKQKRCRISKYAPIPVRPVPAVVQGAAADAMAVAIPRRKEVAVRSMAESATDGAESKKLALRHNLP